MDSSAAAAGEGIGEPSSGGGWPWRAFPHGDGVPALVAERVLIAKVPGPVSLDLAFPPCAAGFRQAEVGAMFMAVPEAAVYEDDSVVFRQDEVGFAG